MLDRGWRTGLRDLSYQSFLILSSLLLTLFNFLLFTDKIIALADTLFARTPPDVLKKLCDPEVQKLIYYNQYVLFYTYYHLVPFLLVPVECVRLLLIFTWANLRTAISRVLSETRIAAICKPHVYVDFIDSDWTILQSMRVRHSGGTFLLFVLCVHTLVLAIVVLVLMTGDIIWSNCA